LTTLIRDGIPASKACQVVGISQTALSARLTEARRAAKGASEAERAGQRYYRLLVAYESAQKERSKTLRRQRGSGKAGGNVMDKHPMVYRDLRLLPSDVKQRILDHLKNGSFVADAAESEKVHTSVIMAWLEKGFQAYLGNQEDPVSVLYRELYLDVLAAFARARTSASERIHADSPLSYLLYGPGRESDERQGYQKNPRMVPQAAKQPLEIKTVWATAQHPPSVIAGKLQPFKVEVPPDSDYEPIDRSNWPSEDED